MASEEKRPDGFSVFSFICMAGTYAAVVILLLLAPVLSDDPVAWTGVPAGLVLIWLGRSVVKGRWSQ